VPALVISPLYVGLAAILLVVLGILVIRQRYIHRVAIGDGGHPELQRAMRVQANFVEYVPLGLIAIVLVEAVGESAWVVHGLGGGLILCRVLHAWGFSRHEAFSIGRFVGAQGTFLILLAAGGLLVAASCGVRV